MRMGEAIVAIYIKRLDDEMKDGNPVRAVIRAIAINSDEKTPSFSQPSSDAHETLMRRAYTVAGIPDYSQTGFMECHGTGAPTGDPIETKAVGRVFGDSGVYIGSVKPNVGHTEGASGVVSVIKVVLALENRTIPPNIRLSRLNPNIPFESAKLTVPLKPTAWPHGRVDRASVNSFGAGGAKVDVIIDSAASFNIDVQSKPSLDTHHLLLFSANSQKSLAKLTRNYQDYVFDPQVLRSQFILLNEIGKKLFQLLLKSDEDLNTELSLVELGLDSLLGIELRQWWRQVFGLDVSVLEMLGTGTLDALGKFAVEKLLKGTIAERESA